MGYKITIKDAYDTRTSEQSISQIVKKFRVTYLDPSFQRYGGLENESGWGEKQSSEFVGALLSGQAVGARVMTAIVEDCLRWAKEQKSQVDIEYFQEIFDMHREEISIDGNNTASSINGFVEGKIPAYIPDESDRNKIHVVWFKDLDEEQQNDVLHYRHITKIELRRVSKIGMCKLFRNVNRAVPLNDQERRQSYPTNLAATIREIANAQTNKDGFLFVFKSDSNYDKRVHEQMTAQLCIKHDKSFDTSLKKTALDKYYAEENCVGQAAQKNVRKVLKEVKKCRDAVSNKNQIKTGLWHALCDIIYLIGEYGLQIDDHEAFSTWFLAKHAKYTKYAENLIEKQKEDSYIHWITTYGEQKFYRKTALLFGRDLEDEKEDLINNGVLSEKITRTGKDSFTFKDKLTLWILQDGETREGDVINILDIYRGKYEADHVKSVANGGDTTIENGELMTTKENRKKGSKNNEPHFDFQKQEEVVSRQVAE